MSGLGKNDREALGKRLKRRETWAEAFGWMVGSGLLIEYGKEIVDCFVDRHKPSLALLGGVVVTAGVFGEVLFSRLVVRTSEEISQLADSDVAQANLHAAEAIESARKAEQAGKEADLARVKMEDRLVRRTISRRLTDEEINALQERLKPLSGRKFAITVAATDDTATEEPQVFAWQLSEALHRADWIEERVPGTSRVGHGVIIECKGTDMGSSVELARALGALGIRAKASRIEDDTLPFIRIHVGLL